MNRLLVCHVLLVAFSLAGATPTAEECKELVTPLSLADHSVMEGNGHLLLGYSSDASFNAMLEVTQKSEVNMTVHDDVLTMDEVLKTNGTCYRVGVNMTIEGDKTVMTSVNFTSTFEMLPSCEGCWVISGNNSAKNIKQLFQFMKLDIHAEDETHSRGLYLYAKDPGAVKDEDLERFRKQASCLGFTGNAMFQYNRDKAMCDEDHLVHLPL